MAYTPERIGETSHLPIIMGICGAYAIRPYPNGRKLIEDRLADSSMNPILTDYRIQ